MGALTWVVLPMRRYAQFSGRARRREFWPFTIVATALGACLDYVDEATGLAFEQANWALGSAGLLGAIFSVATLVPSISVSVRRLHDTNRSGWWLVPPTIALFASAGGFAYLDEQSQDFQGVEVAALALFCLLLVSIVTLFALFMIDGTTGPNRFGEDPKAVAYEGVFD